MLLNTDVRKAEVLLINEIKLLIKFGITILAIKTIKQINSISVAIIDKPLFFDIKTSFCTIFCNLFFQSAS